MTLETFTLVDALTLDLGHEPVEGEQLVAGTPHTGSVDLARIGGVDVGVWEMTAGTMRDIEVDEVFVVLAGAAVVEWERADASTQRIELRPGVLCRLTAGMSTRWTVTRPLRKVYLVAESPTAS